MPHSQVIDTLSQYILTDGFHVVVDLDKSHGSWIVDAENGKRYLDCYSQFASQPLGWNHPSLVNAQEELGRVAMHKMANSDMYSKPYAKFVERFASVTRDFKHYFFIDGGALAVENALKAAFDWKAQRLGYTVGMSPSLNQSLADTLDVVHFTNAFHGRSGYTMSLTNTDPLKTRWFPKFNWTRASNPADIEHKMHKDVAAIIIEPVQGEGGDIHFNRATFKHLRKMAYKYDSMLIFDEVQTGLGLTGKMWGYKHYSGVIPDMICFGKKTQVCGFCCTDRINNVPNNVFNVSSRVNSTWGGNIVDMVRFCHIIDAIENDNLVQNAKTIGEYLLGKLMATDGISNVRGKGLMIAFDSPNESTRDRMMELLSENMIALKCGNKSIRLRPHLTFSKEDADTAHSYIEKAAEKL